MFSVFLVIILVKLSAVSVMNYKCSQWSKEDDLDTGVAVSPGLAKNVDLSDK